jgi:hypothetical protein
MSILTDFIFQFQQRILGRYTNKTLPLSIKKEDHANSFNEISNALLLVNPKGLKNQTLFADIDNSNNYIAGNEVEIGQFITNDGELTRALTRGQQSQLEIFNNFKRYSHGGSPTNPVLQTLTNNIPGQPSQTNSWGYDTGSNRVTSTFNSGSAIGLISREKYDNYTHSVTIGADNGVTPDNDRIGIVIAFMEDSDDMVTNWAYGLDSSDFNWPIDVINPLVPNQHALTLYIAREGTLFTYFVAYDYIKLTQTIIVNGSSLGGLFNTTANWAGNTVDVEIVRNGDNISIRRSQFSDEPGGKGSLGFALNVDLNSNPLLYKFKGKQSCGYSAQSQNAAFYENIVFSGSENVIYDLRDGSTYVFGSSGYNIDTARSFFNEIGVERLLFNPYELNLIYLDAAYNIYLLSTRSSIYPVRDNNKRIVFSNQTQVNIDWQNDLAPESTLTFAQLFGNNPIIATWINNGDNTYSKLSEDGETRNKEIDQVTLLTVIINLGASPQSGEIIIT